MNVRIKEPTHNLHSFFRFLFYAIITLVVGYYAYYQSQELLAGPYIAFSSPANGSVVTDTVITVEGKAERISFIRLNGRQIFIDENGVFEEELPLLPGHNIMELRATDRFGRITTEMLYLTHEREQ